MGPEITEAKITEADALFTFKRNGGVLEVSVDRRDGSIEVEGRDVPHRPYVSEDCLHYLSPDEVAQVVATLPAALAVQPSGDDEGWLSPADLAARPSTDEGER